MTRVSQFEFDFWIVLKIYPIQIRLLVLDLGSDKRVSWKEHYQFDIIYLKDLLKTSINNIDVGISNIHQPNHTVQFEVKNFGEEFWEVPCLPHYVTLAVHRSE